jgi:hypothetical protein
MLRRLWKRVYLDIEHWRLWLDGSWHTVYESKDGYFCPHLSVEDVSKVRSEDLPKGLTLVVSVPVKLGSVNARLYVERGVVELYVDVDWSYWSYAVSKEEFVDRLTKRLERLGYSVEASEDGVKASMTCSGKLSQYLEDLVEGIDNVSRYVSSLDRRRIGEVSRVLESIYGIDGRTLASRRDLSGVARIIVASLKSDDIAYLLLESGGMDRFVKTIIYREVRLDVNAILERLRALGLYRYAGKRLQPVWPFQPVQSIVRHLYSSLDGGGKTVSSFLNAHYLMTYIKRDGNLYSLIVRDSRFGRDVKWRYSLKKFLEDRLFPNLTFIDVALTASICLGIPAPLNRLRESLETLKTLGIISENLKPLPYATHITRLVKGYMTKTKLVRNPRDRKEWENILGWRTLTKTPYRLLRGLM